MFIQKLIGMTDKLITKLTRTCFRITNNMFVSLFQFENSKIESTFHAILIEIILSLPEGILG